MNNFWAKIYSILPAFLQKAWDRVEESDIGSRMVKGAFWSLTGSIVSRGLMLLASIIVARILGKTQYGELGMIRSTVNMFVVFAGFGLGLTATKYIAEFREKDKIKAGRIIGLSTIFAGLSGGIVALIILILTPYIATKTINAPHLVNELRLGAFMLFFSALNGAQTGVLAGYESFKAIARINLLSGLLAFPIQVVFTLLWGLTGSVIGFGSNFLFLWMLNYFAVRKESKAFSINIDFISCWNEWSVLYKFSLPAVLSGLLVSPVIWVCNTMLVNQTNGYEEMAIFDVGFLWRNSVLFIPTVISQITLPLLSSNIEDKMRYSKIIRMNIIINVSISLIIAIILSLFSKLILNSYGKDFASGQAVFIILLLTTVLISFNSIIGQAIAGKGKMWHGFILNFIWAISILGISYYFKTKYGGAYGLALAYFLSYIIHSITQSIILKTKIL